LVILDSYLVSERNLALAEGIQEADVETSWMEENERRREFAGSREVLRILQLVRRQEDDDLKDNLFSRLLRRMDRVLNI